MQKRLTALLLVMALTGAPGRLILRVSADEVKEITQKQVTSSGAQNTMFSVLGLSFLCAGGLVALIMVKDRT